MTTLPTLLTIGYEGAEMYAFLDTLAAHGVTVLVDVRERAQSRRPGYSKTALSHALEGQGIGYRHMRSLGTPPAIRKAYRLDQDFAAMKAGYTLHLATQQHALEELGALTARERVCLLCYEADAQKCHRSLTAARLQKMELVGAVENLVAGRQAGPSTHDDTERTTPGNRTSERFSTPQPPLKAGQSVSSRGPGTEWFRLG